MELPAEIRSATFIVIAAYNEAEVIASVVQELIAEYPNVVVVDDGSRDDTGPRARAAGAVVLRHVINRGQGAALQTGITYSLRRGARFIVTYDADGQHRPEDLPAMLAPLAGGEVDICLGSRFLREGSGVPLARRLLLRAALLFTWVMSGVRLSDTHNGFRAFTRRAAEHIDIRLDRMAHASELIDQVRRCKLPYREIPVEIRYTDYSVAKGQRSHDAFRVAFDYVVGRLLR